LIVLSLGRTLDLLDVAINTNLHYNVSDRGVRLV
jgi:hypothetical protein